MRIPNSTCAPTTAVTTGPTTAAPFGDAPAIGRTLVNKNDALTAIPAMNDIHRNASLGTTQRYTNLDADRLIEVYRKSHPKASGPE